MKTYYAIRPGFGSEGHGELIIEATSNVSADDCDNKARRSLQDQFGGLWAGKMRDTYIGSRDFLVKESPFTKAQIDAALLCFEEQEAIGLPDQACGCPGAGHVRACPGYGL